MSDELKKKGNDAFAAGRFEEAVEHFTSGLLQDPSNAVLYSNRSAAEASIGLWESALHDAERAIEMRPDWGKGYSRRGAALLGLGQAERSVESFTRGLELEPGNAAMQQGLEQARRATAQQPSRPSFANPFNDPQLMQRLAQDPRTASYLSQPDFMAKLREMQVNPGALGQHLGDQRVMEALTAMLNINTAPTSAEEEQHQPAMHEEPAKKQKEEEAKLKEPDLTEEQREVLILKEQGTSAYKARDFPLALKHYDAAIALDPLNTSLFANKSAVLFEQGSYTECLAVCEAAVALGREQHAEFKLIGRILGRMGSCYERMGDLPAAIRYYQKALNEARNPELADKLKAAERALVQFEKAARYDPTVAEQERQQGNAAFARQDWPTAVRHYTEAIRRDEADPRAYSNRAACYLKLAAIPDGLRDAEKCIELDPVFVKGYVRKAALLAAKREWSQAISACEAGMERDTDGKNRMDFQQILSRCYAAMNSGASGPESESGLTEEERAQRAMQNPEVQAIMHDPTMRSILEQMKSDPAAIREHMRNPVVAAKMRTLAQHGIIRMQ